MGQHSWSQQDASILGDEFLVAARSRSDSERLPVSSSTPKTAPRLPWPTHPTYMAYQWFTTWISVLNRKLQPVPNLVAPMADDQRERRAEVVASMRESVVPRLPTALDDDYLAGAMDTAEYMATHIRWLQAVAERAGVALGTMALEGFSYRAATVQTAIDAADTSDTPAPPVQPERFPIR